MHPLMDLAQLLAPKKAAIVKKWYERVVAGYAKETARFLNTQKDPFQNPVGMHTQQSLQALVDLLGSDADPATLQKALDPTIRIRAIQAFTPSKAVGFIFELKDLIRDVLPELNKQDKAVQRLTIELDKQIDEMALAAFDVFVQCREKIYELQAGEMRERTYKAFARAGLVKDPI